jgi:hypothetical protein
MTAEDNQEIADDTPLSPEQMLALVKDQQRSVAGQRGAFVHWILLAWGVAWLLGFGALWLAAGGWPGVSIPIQIAAPAFAALLIAAGILSTVLGIRSDRGVRDQQGAFAGVIYGQLWWVGGVAIFVMGQALAFNGMDQSLLGVFYPSAFIFFAGLMYVMAGVIWRAIPMVILGGWSIFLSAVAPFLGMPAHYLGFALAGGGGFLLAALWSWLWLQRTRRRLTAGTRL